MSSILGTPSKEFNQNKFRDLFYKAKSRKELQPALTYLLGYFACGETGVYKWVPALKTFKHFNKKDACESFIQNETAEFEHGNWVEKFNIQNWFFRETPIFIINVDPTKPLTYQHPISEEYIINNFPGFLHSNPPPFHQFSKEIRNQVNLILNHMREVLCSSDKKQELYMMGLILRIAIGQKMQKSMFLYSGPGTGKTMLTWFLREMVLGSKITMKTTNEKIITGQFNKELEGRVLLVLEEMSNSKSTDWITFANWLKDFIDSDSLRIEEKHKTPYSVTNITNLIINSNNSKTIRLDKNDRRYFIPDISEKYVENGIGMDHYYAPLDKAIKNPEVGKAFYSYALEYVKLNPDFNECKIPMSKTKLMMTSRDINPIHEFIKQEYLCKSLDLDLASTYLYNTYKNWFREMFGIKKRPPIVQEFTRAIGELGIKTKSKRVGDQKTNKKMQWYSASYNDIYTIFQKKNMIDEAENINEPEGYQHTEKFDEEEVYESSGLEFDEPILKNKKPEVSLESPAECSKSSVPVFKKMSPKVPPKPEHLKITKNNETQKLENPIEEFSIDECLDLLCAEYDENCQDNRNTEPETINEKECTLAEEEEEFSENEYIDYKELDKFHNN
ncbi:8344_t:CDS:2 [Entrophospora sp. SA101]|nr:11885_t:CDS:2 [Entrophospora sp. SA101]CAJ0847465.1 8344_t:CDS:2 [Entrophospora sp. SA101]